MQHTFRLHTASISILLIFLIIFSAGCAGSHESTLSEPSEQTSAAIPEDTPSPAPSQSPSPTPALTMEQKASMVWMGDDYQACYPSDIVVFSANVKGQNKLIWTCIEDKQVNRSYSYFEPFSSNELRIYDLFNREYLFTLSLPINALAANKVSAFYQYIIDISPALENATFLNSDSVLNLEELYKKANVDITNIPNIGSVINSYIYNESNTISPWDKSKALQAFCAITPEGYVLPYWELIPSLSMPENVNSIDVFVRASVPVERYTEEQKQLLLGSKPDSEWTSMDSIISFLCIIDGRYRIIWTFGYRNSDETDDTYSVEDFHSAFNNEFLFSLRYTLEEHKKGISISDIWKYFYRSSPQLDGIQLRGSGGLKDISESYSKWGIRYTGNELLDSLKASWDNGDFSCLDTPISHDELLQLYLDTVPDEYLMPFWEYVPDAVTPDGFFTPTPEIAPTPAP